MALLKKVNHIWASIRTIHLKNGIVGQPFKYVNLDYRLNLDNRVKASTLMETLVATVLIVVIFMISSMIMNNLLVSNVKQNTELAEERLNALEYQYKNQGIKLPYYEDFESWEISIFEEKRGENAIVTLEAENMNTKTVVTNFVTSEE